jgi:hypothetical protein
LLGYVINTGFFAIYNDESEFSALSAFTDFIFEFDNDFESLTNILDLDKWEMKFKEIWEENYQNNDWYGTTDFNGKCHNPHRKTG